jgi:hypothetical protein
MENDIVPIKIYLIIHVCGVHTYMHTFYSTYCTCHAHTTKVHMNMKVPPIGTVHDPIRFLTRFLTTI